MVTVWPLLDESVIVPLVPLLPFAFSKNVVFLLFSVVVINTKLKVETTSVLLTLSDALKVNVPLVVVATPCALGVTVNTFVLLPVPCDTVARPLKLVSAMALYVIAKPSGSVATIVFTVVVLPSVAKL